MNLFLLNSIHVSASTTTTCSSKSCSSRFSKKHFAKNFNFDKLKSNIKSIEQRKKDNLKKTTAFMKELGEKDIEYLKQLHSTMVDEVQKEKEYYEKNPTAIVPFVITTLLAQLLRSMTRKKIFLIIKLNKNVL